MPSVFVSSTIPELEAEREIVEETLICLGFRKDEIIMWEKTPGGSVLARESFLSSVDKAQVFVVILWKEFSEFVVEEYRRAAQAKIPILAFVKKIYSDYGENRDTKLHNFIKSILYHWKEFRGLEDLKMTLRTTFLAEMCRHLKPCLSISSPQLFQLGEDIFSSAKDRIVLLARSLILVVGPRPYLSDSPYDYEKSHYKCLLDIVRNAKEAKDGKKFSCGYIIPKTLKVFQDNPPQLRRLAKDNITRLFNDSQANIKTSLFKLCTPSPTWDPPFTFVVGDDRFAIWFKDPSDPRICPCISAEDKTIATALIHIFEDECKPRQLETILGELKLDALEEGEAKTKRSGLSVSRIFDGLEGKK